MNINEASMRERQQKQVDDNYAAFQKLDDRFFEEHYGKYALMRDCKVVEVFDSWQDARKTAMLLYTDKHFSLQKVDKAPIDLGFYSYGIF
ncbi:MAG: hypothetical protein OD817_05305 [Gammaproteobacteria bacterium]